MAFAASSVAFAARRYATTSSVAAPPSWCSQVIVCELSVRCCVVSTPAASASARFGVSKRLASTATIARMKSVSVGRSSSFPLNRLAWPELWKLSTVGGSR